MNVEERAAVAAELKATGKCNCTQSVVKVFEDKLPIDDETLMKLTQLLRGVLRSTEEFCSLGEEIKLIENYLDIEKTRFEERLRVRIKIPKGLEKMRVPSLILQPLVENAQARSS